MKNLIFSTIFLFCFSVLGKAEPQTHSMTELIVQVAATVLFFTAIIVTEIWYSNRKEKKTNELTAKEKPLKIFEYFNVFKGENEVSPQMIVLCHRNYCISCNILLFKNRIVFVTESMLEIELKDINSANIKKAFGEELLKINYSEISESGTKKEMSLYLQGSDENMLYIKNFIEERMDRPKIIDLT